MANTNDLKRQHNEIKELVDYLKLNLEADKVKAEASQIALKINTLAGKLRVHLIAEDDCLYPKLLKEGNNKAKEVAECFFLEMGNLSQVFMDYKGRYNISSKIFSNVEEYIKDTKVIVDALQNRIHKEDTELYILL